MLVRDRATKDETLVRVHILERCQSTEVYRLSRNYLSEVRIMFERFTDRAGP